MPVIVSNVTSRSAVTDNAPPVASTNAVSTPDNVTVPRPPPAITGDPTNVAVIDVPSPVNVAVSEADGLPASREIVDQA